jgi:hypothetical protein
MLQFGSLLWNFRFLKYLFNEFESQDIWHLMYMCSIYLRNDTIKHKEAYCTERNNLFVCLFPPPSVLLAVE